MYEVTGKYTSAKVFIEKEDIGVTEQTLNICNHPIFKDCIVRIMPDCHRGKGCTIGFTSTMPKNGEIIPNIIGVDQSCGMLTIKLKECRTLRDYYKLDKVIRQYVPVRTNGRKEISEMIGEKLKEKVTKAVKDYLKTDPDADLKKIGSLGDGNHFISLERGQSGTYLIIHSGSRNFGNKLAIYFQQQAIEQNCYGEGELKNLSYLSGKKAEEYLECASICAEYAYFNRWVMAEEILKNMDWEIEDYFETVHNYIGEDDIIRKGAVSCYKEERILIPLNMADGSLICIGKGLKDWNKSAPHGAGRLLSRTQAKNQLTMKEYKESMKGIHSSCICTGTLDEAPGAYKNSEEIINAIQPSARIVDHLKPIYNFKAK